MGHHYLHWQSNNKWGNWELGQEQSGGSSLKSSMFSCWTNSSLFQLILFRCLEKIGAHCCFFNSEVFSSEVIHNEGYCPSGWHRDHCLQRKNTERICLLFSVKKGRTGLKVFDRQCPRWKMLVYICLLLDFNSGFNT